MEINKIYENLMEVPSNALKPIEFGNLKGKSDINPQWKIEALTKEFGLCGFGWKYEIDKVDTFNCQDGQVLLYLRLSFYFKQEEKWSDPVYGYGGDFILKKNKNGLVPNDEAFKMCLTDALGNAIKNIGVAGSIFRGLYDGSKYARREEEYKEAHKTITKEQVGKILDLISATNADEKIMCQYYKVKKIEEMTEEIYQKAYHALEAKLAKEEKAQRAGETKQ